MGVESSIIVAYVTYIIVVLIIATGIQLRTSSSLGTRSAIILSNVIMLPLTIVAMLVAGHLVAGLDMGEVASTLVFALAAVLLLAVARHALPVANRSGHLMSSLQWAVLLQAPVVTLAAIVLFLEVFRGRGI